MVFLLFFIGTIIRISAMYRDTFMDEAFTYFFSLKPISFIIGGNDVHPPLHYLYAKPFALLFGNNIYLLRLSSLALWGVFFLLCYQYIKRKLGKDVALYASLFLTLNPMLVYYSTEFRMYMLLLTLFIINLITFDNWLKDPSKKNAIYFIIPSVLMAYTHIFSGTAIAVELIYSLLSKTKIKKTLITFTIIGLASLPSIFLIYSVYQANPTFHFSATTWMSLISTYFFMFSLPTKTFFLFFIFIFALLYYMVRYDTDFKGMGLYVLFMLLPVPIYILSKFTSIYHHRFMIFMVIPLAIFVGYIMDDARKKTTNGADILAGLFLVAIIYTMMLTPDPFFETRRNSNIATTNEMPDIPIIHQYPLSYLPYSMVQNRTRNYLIGEIDFTFCGSVIDPDNKIVRFFDPPYYYVNYTYKNNEFIEESVTLFRG